MYLPLSLGRALYAECSVLVWHDVILVFRVQWLEVLGNQNFLVGQLICGLGEVLEEVGVVGSMEVEVCRVGVARLLLLVIVKVFGVKHLTMIDGDPRPSLPSETPNIPCKPKLACTQLLIEQVQM